MSGRDAPGIAASVRSDGPAAGHPVVLVHGAANDGDAWRDVAPLLAARGLRVIVPELPGHGASHDTALRTIEEAADWLLRLADRLELQHFSVVGHSMGSLIALAAAARDGERVAALALLGCSVPMPVSAALLDAARADPDMACRLVTAWSHTPRFLRTGGGGHGVCGPGKTLAVLRRNASTLAGDLAACASYESGLVAARAVRCKTLLVAGQRDRMTPVRAAQALESALMLRQRQVIGDCGHAMMVERPREVAEALAGFIPA